MMRYNNAWIVGLIALMISCDKQGPIVFSEIDILPISMQWRYFMDKKDSYSQGMSIWNNMIFIAHDGGKCDVYNLKTKEYINSFFFASSQTSNHCNCINFGPVVSSGQSSLLYISNGKVASDGEWQCRVESISVTRDGFKSELRQTITLDAKDFILRGYHSPWGCPMWLVDNERGYLWVWSADLRTIPSITGGFGNNSYHATCFRLPSLLEGDHVVLSGSDVLRQVVFEFDAYATQGGCMRDGIIYYSYGFGYEQIPPKIRGYNTDTGEICLKVDLSGLVDIELEDLALNEGVIYVNTNSSYIFQLSVINQ